MSAKRIAPLTRRSLLKRMAAATSLIAVGLPRIPAAAALALTRAARPVVSFHMDQPYVDLSGSAKPYLPPLGSRSASPLGALDAQELKMRHPYL